MAVSATHSGHYVGDGSGGASKTSDSVWAIPGNQLVFWNVCSATPGELAANIPTMTGNGITWTAIATKTVGVAGNVRETLFAGMAASPTTDVVTVDFGGQNQLIVYGFGTLFAGMDTTSAATAVVQVLTASGTSQTALVTLAAFGSAGNGTFGASLFVTTDTVASHNGSGFTGLASWASSILNPYTEFRADNDTTVDVTNDHNVDWIMIGAEIKSAGGTTAYSLGLAALTYALTVSDVTTTYAPVGGTHANTLSLAAVSYTLTLSAVTLEHATVFSDPLTVALAISDVTLTYTPAAAHVYSLALDALSPFTVSIAALGMLAARSLPLAALSYTAPMSNAAGNRMHLLKNGVEKSGGEAMQGYYYGTV